MQVSLSIIVAALAFCFTARAQSADTAASRRYRVSVVTLGSGEHLFTRFGHTAIRLEDLKTGIDKVYNFGDFDYTQENLTHKFLAGTLRYYISVGAFDFLRRAVEKGNRSLTVQVLCLSEKEVRRVREMLELSVQPAHRDYVYDHYRANCCTKVRDVIDDATSGLLRRGRRQPSRTFRYWTRRSLDDAPFLNLFFNWVLNGRIDAPIDDFDALYLPSTLADALARTKRPDGTPLVSATRIEVPNRTRTPPSNLERAVLLAAALLLTVLMVLPVFFGADKKVVRLFGAGLMLFGLVTGSAGALLLLLRAWTSLPDLQASENLLIFPPTHWAFAAAGVLLLRRGTASSRIIRWTTILTAVSLVSVAVVGLLKLRPFGQDNLLFLGFDLLWLLCGVAGLYAIARKRSGRC